MASLSPQQLFGAAEQAYLGGRLAEDVASETWVSVVKGLARFTGDEAGWRAWVFTIARSRLYDAQRRAARMPARREWRPAAA